MSGIETKEKLQKFFDKGISSIYEKENLYYVTLDDGSFIKQVYEVDINANRVREVGVSAVVLFKKYKLIWSKNS